MNSTRTLRIQGLRIQGLHNTQIEIPAGIQVKVAQSSRGPWYIASHLTYLPAWNWMVIQKLISTKDQRTWRSTLPMRIRNGRIVSK